jgi:hypothetical protein
MRNRLIPVGLREWTLGPAAGAQTKLSGNKPDAQYAIELADRPNHSLTMAKFTCTWSKPWRSPESRGRRAIALFPAKASAQSYWPRLPFGQQGQPGQVLPAIRARISGRMARRRARQVRRASLAARES